jgi:hypothetical protein
LSLIPSIFTDKGDRFSKESGRNTVGLKALVVPPAAHGLTVAEVKA